MNKNTPLLAGIILSSAVFSTSTFALEITENEGQTEVEEVQLPPNAPAPIPADTTTIDVAKKEVATTAKDSTKEPEKPAIINTTKVEDNVPVTKSNGRYVYITDNAYVWMTRGPGKQYRLNGTARAGDEVQVLAEQNGYLQIKIPNGKIGWIPKTEVQTQTSFRTEVTSLKSENQALKFKLDNIDSETARELKLAQSELATVTKERDELAKKHAEDSAKLAEIQERNKELEGKLETKAQDMQLRWWKEGGMIAGIGALAGIILVYLPRPRRKRDDYY